MTGAELRARREALGLGQRELARLLGVSSSTLYRWEHGKMRIDSERMLALALDRLAQERVTLPD